MDLVLHKVLEEVVVVAMDEMRIAFVEDIILMEDLAYDDVARLVEELEEEFVDSLVSRTMDRIFQEHKSREVERNMSRLHCNRSTDHSIQILPD